jgi:chromosome condensin MukBEF ATPase and DNA-binding subunit MukB
MAEDTEVHHQLGSLDARMVAVERDIKEMRSDVREMRDAILSAKGSWKMLLGIASFAAIVGGLVMQVVHWLVART